MTTLVLCGNYDEFLGLQHRYIDRNLVYLSCVEKVRGRSSINARFVRYGTWYNRRDLTEILDALKEAGVQKGTI